MFEAMQEGWSNHAWCLFWMLLGAFLLGLLLGWILWYNYRKRYLELKDANNRLKTRNTLLEKESAELSYNKNELEKSNSGLKVSLNRCEADRAVLETKLSKADSYGSGVDDDNLSVRVKNEGLLALSGMDENIAGLLEKNNIGSISDLANADETVLADIFKGTKHNWYYLRGQARLAERNDWNALAAYRSNSYAMALRNDNLQIIEGIGPKIEQLLKDAGIHTWWLLANSPVSRLQGVLNEAGPSYKMHKPSTWPQQAEYAANGKWDELVRYQKMLDPNKEISSGETPSKAEKLVIRILGIGTNPEDLKIVEGIGPKIEQLLKAGGINNWAGLAKAKVSRLKEILTKAGPRYQLAVPDTWPKQAELASQRKWGELREYQDYLQGGRDLAKK